jgi:hypothetical protein
MDRLVQKWREKVYECLVTNKRYELIIKDNVRNFRFESSQLTEELK